MNVPARFRKVAVVLVVLVLALWFLLPGRNQYGNPSMEQQASSCSCADGLIIRLYKGEEGATVAFWYTVTAEGGLFEREQQILFAYDSPVISNLSCEEGRVHLDGGAFRATLNSEDIKAMRQRPRHYWKGQLRSANNNGEPAV